MPKKPFKNPLSTVDITKDKVKKKLTKLKISKSPGPDQLHPRLLRELAEEISAPLADLYTASLKTGQLPADWKQGEISPIFKKGNRNMCSNYRPVSLTSIVCKTLESIIRDDIISHMKDNKLFSDKQYGFINGRSTTLQLLKILDDWTKILDEGGTVDVIYLDFMKAFDTVAHLRLLIKAESYGIVGELLTWIENFLTNRKQRVRVGSETSSWSSVESGIPQGSVLGPILFIIYINDLPDCVNKDSDCYMFADDSKVYRRSDKPGQTTILQNDLDNLHEWSNTWQMGYHPQKTKIMPIGYKNRNYPSYHLYKRNNNGIIEEVPLEISTLEKDLGVLIDSNLNFEEQIIAKANKANSIMGMIRRNFIYMDATIFKYLFKAVVRPHIETSNAVWYPFKKKHIDMLESVQRRATKLIPGFSKLNYQERLQKLNIPTLVYRRQRGDMIEVFKILKGFYDRDVSPNLILNTASSTRGHSLKLFQQGSKLNIRKYSFSVRVTSLWNSLPESVVEAKDVQSFKNKLDKHWKDLPIKYQYIE